MPLPDVYKNVVARWRSRGVAMSDESASKGEGGGAGISGTEKSFPRCLGVRGDTESTKGIILAGGRGTRLAPLTTITSKQLLPVFDKPMIYYPLTTLMLAGIRDIALITTAEDQDSFKRLLGDGSQWGIALTYLIQEAPRGLPDAFVVADSFIAAKKTILILGDNLLYGSGLGVMLKDCLAKLQGAHILTNWVQDPSRYGVVHFDAQARPIELEEKPKDGRSPWAIPGIYIVDGQATSIAKNLKPSSRNETEIVDFLRQYLFQNKLSVTRLNRGYAWFDAGTHKSLLQAADFIAALQNRQGLMVASPEEVAFNMGYISLDDLERLVREYPESSYKAHLKRLMDELLFENVSPHSMSVVNADYA